jgi:energy-converting hydrogenase Eha subunit G
MVLPLVIAMGKFMNVFVGLLILAQGIIFTVYSKRLARATNEFYESMSWPHVSERWIKFAFRLAGAIFSFFGILAISGLINF